MYDENENGMQTNLKDKIILITGSSQGLGAYYAELLAKNHATVIVSGRNHDKINHVVESIRAQGHLAEPLQLDMTDFASFENKVNEVIQRFGRIDVLINNAAVSHDKNIFDIEITDWDLHMDTNLKGLFFLSQTVAKQMQQQTNGGNIINIAAINGERIRKNCIPFSISKAALIHLTKAMAYELIEYNIKVNALSLGLFPSEFVSDFLQNDPTAQNYLNQIPVKRPGEFSELDGPILLLASNASDYMHGSVLQVDGGFAINVFYS